MSHFIYHCKRGKVAIITGADSGIGRSVAILFAREGANCTIVYHTQKEDAEQTKQLCEKEGARALTMQGDLRDKSFCEMVKLRRFRCF